MIQIYKFTVSNILTLAMSGLNVCMILLYGQLLIKSWESQYIIGRTRKEVTEIVDFEPVKVLKNFYFLYLNNDPGAIDAVGSKNRFYIMNVEKFCYNKLEEHHGMPDLMELSADVQFIRDNYNGNFIKGSEIFILVAMGCFTIFNSLFVPFRLKDRQIPIIFRNSDTNEWYERRRVQNFIFFLIWIMGGCLPNLSFFAYGAPCLHTSDNERFSVTVSDRYQYLLATFLWVLIIPGLVMSISLLFRDKSGLICFPCLIANTVFGFIMMFLSLYIIANVCFLAYDYYLMWIHRFHAMAFVLGVLNNYIYYHTLYQIDIGRSKDVRTE